MIGLFGGLFGLIGLGTYVFAAMGLSAMFVLVAGGDIPLSVIAQEMVRGIDSPSLVSVPMYILVGEVMLVSGITERLVNFSKLLVGHVRGGLAYVGVLADMFMGGISGSAIADSVATEAIMLPAMEKAGYRADFAVAVNGTASTIGAVVPPSIPIIFLALITNLSVGQLFLGGLVPGVLMGVFLMIALFFIMRRGDFPAGEPIDRSAGAIVATLKDSFFALLAPLVIVSGAVLGVVTINEAALLAAAYVLFVGVVVYRRIKLRELPGIFLRTAVFSSTLMIIFAAIGPFSLIMARARAAQRLTDFMEMLNLGPVGFMIFLIVILLVLGMVIDGLAVILLFVPVLLPAGVAFGYDPIHLSIVMVLVLVIGLITPPMGALLFVMTKMSGVPFERIVRANMPFLLVLILLVIVIAAFEELVIWLPRTVFGT
jgi:tripartite ATP-independent transporter DctM subunit